MRNEVRLSCFLQAVAVTVCALASDLLLEGSAARAQVSSGTDINLSRRTGHENECAISKNPVNGNQLFAFCNTRDAGLFAARSTDGGATWVPADAADETIADGDPGQGLAACCDPTSAWDTFGNLFITYLDSNAGNVVTILSTDGGATLSDLATFAGSVDQPTVVAANTSAPGAPVAVWIVWNQSGRMVARGAAVTGLGSIGAFGTLQVIPGTAGCSFGDIAIAPAGAVVQACQTMGIGGEGPATILVNTDADGLGPGNFGAAVAAATTNVGGFDFIPPQDSRSVDAEAGLAFDSNAASPNFGRLYLVYTDEVVDESDDTDIMLRFSDNGGVTWTAPPIRVNDDPARPIRSQFLPKISLDALSGDIAICWHDCRNSATNTAMQEFCTIVTPTGATPIILANAQISDGSSTSTGSGVEFGDYSGLAHFQGVAHPIWADTSNSTGNNPDGTANFDAFTDRVTGESVSLRCHHRTATQTGAGGDSAQVALGIWPSQPGLAGFHFDYLDKDHHIDEIKVSVKSERVDAAFNDKNDDDKFQWQASGWSLPAGTTYGHVSGASSGGSASSDRLTGVGVFVLTGFRVSYSGDDHHLDEIGVEFVEHAGETRVKVAFNDKNDDDDFSYEVWYAAVPRESVVGTDRTQLHGPIAGAELNLDLGLPSSSVVLRGFHGHYTSAFTHGEDHHIDELGFEVLPGGRVNVWYNDKNDDDAFEWYLDWAEVSACAGGRRPRPPHRAP